ncbi:MAG: hypothetical protein ABJ275_00155 [Maricaulaceae bacterium]
MDNVKTLKLRLAKGEVSIDEYNFIMKELGAAPDETETSSVETSETLKDNKSLPPESPTEEFAQDIEEDLPDEIITSKSFQEFAKSVESFAKESLKVQSFLIKWGYILSIFAFIVIFLFTSNLLTEILINFKEFPEDDNGDSVLGGIFGSLLLTSFLIELGAPKVKRYLFNSLALSWSKDADNLTKKKILKLGTELKQAGIQVFIKPRGEHLAPSQSWNNFHGLQGTGTFTEIFAGSISIDFCKDGTSLEKWTIDDGILRKG